MNCASELRTTRLRKAVRSRLHTSESSCAVMVADLALQTEETAAIESESREIV